MTTSYEGLIQKNLARFFSDLAPDGEEPLGARKESKCFFSGPLVKTAVWGPMGSVCQAGSWLIRGPFSFLFTPSMPGLNP